jgi:hypothetical protein
LEEGLKELGKVIAVDFLLFLDDWQSNRLQSVSIDGVLLRHLVLSREKEGGNHVSLDVLASDLDDVQKARAVSVVVRDQAGEKTMVSGHVSVDEDPVEYPGVLVDVFQSVVTLTDSSFNDFLDSLQSSVLKNISFFGVKDFASKKSPVDLHDKVSVVLSLIDKNFLQGEQVFLSNYIEK